MFKRILIATLSLALIATSVPSYAKFGGSRSSISGNKSTSFGSSRSSSYSSNRSSTYTPRPSTPPRQSSFGGGNNVGMQRSAVTNSVRQGNTGVGASAHNSVNSTSGGSGYNGGSRNTVINNHYNNGSSFGNGTGTGGFGMGSMAMAAMGGYMLNGALHNRDGSLYSGQGYYNGMPVAGGQYAPSAGYAQQPSINSEQYSGASVMPLAPVQVVAVDRGTGWFWTFIQVLLAILIIGAIIWAVRRYLLNRGSTPAPLAVFTPAETKLENDKETFFINFQKNNSPSGIAYIQANSVEFLFEAIKDNVLAGDDSANVVVKSLEAVVVDVSYEGTKQIGSVHYVASISTNDVLEDINEVWHFVYERGTWKLAGIEQT